MARLHFFMLCVVAMLVSLVHSGRIRRVVNGQPLPRGEWPWLVSLHYQQDHEYLRLQGLDHLCAAVLIAPSWLLTAGHCVTPELGAGLTNESNWIAVAGDYHRRVNESTEQKLYIQEIFKSPVFCLDPEFTGDIALLKLRRPARLNNYVRPIALDDGILIPDGTRCQVAGWGQHTEGEYGNGTMVPHIVSMRKDTEEHCKAAFNGTFYKIDDNVLCFTSDEKKDTCQGDSGGPLVCQNPWGLNVLSGIVSGGSGCGRENSPGAYSRVSSYVSWIRETIALN